jgi:hypothetical protein
MRKMMVIFVGLLFVTLIGGNAFAQNPMIYPAKGQSQEQTEKDKYECYSWAKGQSGFDPMQAGSSPPPAPQGQPIGGERVRGAAGGAAVGAAVGAIAGNAGKGAAAGAVGGTMIGGMRQRQKMREQAEAQQQQNAGLAQNRNNYNRAFGACMEGRGYTVK